MDPTSLIGIVLGFLLIVSAIILGGDVHNFINIPGMMIVVGGTTAATLLTFQLSDVMAAFKSAFIVFTRDKQDLNATVANMLKLCNLSRSKGLLGFQDVETSSPFLGRACDLIADAADEELLHAVLRTEINALKARHFIVQDVFKKMGLYAPALGMLGTLIGMVQMLSKLQDPSSIGPSMAVALLTTFYGTLLSTMIFLPIAGKLKSRTVLEVMNLEIIFEGAISLLEDNNQLSVYERLSSYIPRSQRKSFSYLKNRIKSNEQAKKK